MKCRHTNQECKFDKYSDICNMCSCIAPSELTKIAFEHKLNDVFAKHSHGVSEAYDKTSIIEDILTWFDCFQNIQTKCFIDEADKWLHSHLPRVIENYPSADLLSTETYTMLNEDMREDFRQAMNEIF